ncbi:MAG: hypothetical protein J6V99_03835 [Neisseriaceae bacterium]|nr:hypothetical protein [Neisseriaceae bacterium]
MNRMKQFQLTALACALMSISAPAFAETESPFSLPLYLTGDTTESNIQTINTTKTQQYEKVTTKGGTVTTSGAILPNILLYFDDSGSMADNIDPRTGRKMPGRIGYMTTLKKALNESLNADFTDKSGTTRKIIDRANWGLSWMNHHGGNGMMWGLPVIGTATGGKNKAVVIPDITPVGIGGTNKIELLDAINSATSNGGTPFGGSYMWAVADLYPHIRYRCQKNYVIALTDGAANGGVVDAARLNASEPWKTIGSKGYSPALTDYYEMFVGDGYSVLGPLLAGKDLKTDAKHGKDVAGQSWDDPMFPSQTIDTFTIGIGLDALTQSRLDKLATPLTDKSGNKLKTAYQLTDGDMSGHEKLKDAFSSIFSIIANASSSKDTTPSIDVTPGTVVASPVSVPGKSTASSAITVDSYTVASPALTSGTGTEQEMPTDVAAILVDKNMRSSRIFFDKRKADGSIDTSIKNEDRPTALMTGAKYYVSKNGKMEEVSAYVKDNAYYDITSSDANEYKPGLFNWLTRKSVDYTKYSTADYRTERGQMGDILEADILALGKPVGATKKPDGTVTGGGKELVMTAANDGTVYIFRRDSKATEKYPYSLLYGYMPVDMTRSEVGDSLSKHYKKIAREDYATTSDNPHIFMLSGGLNAQQLEQVDSDGKKYLGRAYLVGNAGRGARGVYGLDLADNMGNVYGYGKSLFTNIDAATPGFEGLGYTHGQTIVAYAGRNVSKDRASGKIGPCPADGHSSCDVGSTLKMISFLGSGIASAGKGLDADGNAKLKEQETALYLFDTFDEGKLLGKVEIKEGEGGLMTPALLDLDFDGVYDYAFAGDYAGNMYRFDIRDYKNITYKRIFQGKGWNDKGFPIRPVLAAPAISRQGKTSEYVVIWGTGSDVFDEDLDVTETQAIYGIYQKFDPASFDIASTDYNNVKEGDLLKQSFTNVTLDAGSGKAGMSYRVASDKPIVDDKGVKKPGWTIDLTGEMDGERVVVKPVIVQQTVFLTSRMYKRSGGSGMTATGLPTDETMPEEIKGDYEAMVKWFTDRPTIWTHTESKKPAKIPDDTSCDWDSIPEITVSDTSDTGTTGAALPAGGDPCLEGGSSITTTTVTKKVCEVSWEESETWKKEKVTPSAYKTKSATIQLRTDNGGALPTDGSYAAVRWVIDGVPGLYGSAQTQDGIISTKISGASETGYNQNQQGEGGWEGVVAGHGGVRNTDTGGNPYSVDPCKDGDAKSFITYGVSDPSGDTSSDEALLSTKTPLCFRRIAWKELKDAVD